VKILIALDDSSQSERAIEFAACMRWPAGSRVIVATVVRPAISRGVLAGGLAGGVPVDLHPESLVMRARDRLRAVGLSAETRIVEGDAGEQLVLLVETERLDLLIVGSRGRAGLAQRLLGSVSSHAVGNAGCSVLVVKHTRTQ